MGKVLLDESLHAKLNGLNQTLDVCDAAGRTVGHFVPHSEYMRLLYARAKVAVTDDEVDRLRGQTGGRHLREILKDLGAE